jgi:hypothetical protein
MRSTSSSSPSSSSSSSARSASLRSLVSVLAATSALALAGCGVEEEDGAELDAEGLGELADVTQEVASTSISTHACSTIDCSFDLGSSSNRTCFLGGIWGSLDQGAADIYPIVGGTYRLRLRHTVGQTVTARAICISGSTNQARASWRGGQPATPIYGTITANRRCFIAGVSNQSGDVRGFDTASDYAEVWKDSSGRWFLGGSLSGSADTFVSTVCVDIPADYGLWGIVAGAGGTAGFNLAYNDGGVVCGFKKLGGKFTSSASGDGIGLAYNSGNRYWSVSAVNSKQATLICNK